jgi:hypothetical protein
MGRGEKKGTGGKEGGGDGCKIEGMGEKGGQSKEVERERWKGRGKVFHVQATERGGHRTAYWGTN